MMEITEDEIGKKILLLGNETSIHLYESDGFFHIGVMNEVGQKFGKRLDAYIMRKIYTTSTDKIN